VGETPHDIAATLNGTLGLALENGENRQRIMLPLISSLMRAGPGRSVPGWPRRTRLRCAAIRLDFNRRRGSSTALVLDSQRVLVQGAAGEPTERDAACGCVRCLRKLGGPALGGAGAGGWHVARAEGDRGFGVHAVAAGEVRWATAADNWLGS